MDVFDNNLSELINRVFNMELLRDKILDYVIHERKDVLISNVRSCRMVNKSWHQSVSRILLKCREPLFRFYLALGNNLTGRVDPQTEGTSVYEFMTLVTGNQDLYPRVPSHSLSVTRDHFMNMSTERYILDWLTNYGSGLVQLDLDLPKSRKQMHSFILLHATPSLPKLRTFRVQVGRGSGENMEKWIDFVQPILLSGQQLQSFEILFDCWESNSLNNLVLPSSITEVYLDCTLYNTRLDALVRNPLPNLKKLHLSSNYTADSDGIVTDILENVRKSLKSFHVYMRDLSSDAPINPTRPLQLPVMEKLESLEINSLDLTLDGNPSSLEQFVPMLNHMSLTNHIVSMVQKWTVRSCFHTVKSLAVGLLDDENEEDEEDGDGDDFYLLRPLIPPAYPNLQKLTLTVRYTEEVMSALLPLTTEIKALRHLQIVFVGGETTQGSDSWDALVIGIPKECLPALRESPDLWKDLQNQSVASIRNNTQLETLELDGRFQKDFSAMSMVAFDFGIFKMPKLAKLILKGAFLRREVEQMATKWQLEEHVISVAGKFIDRMDASSREWFRTTYLTRFSQFDVTPVLNSV